MQLLLYDVTEALFVVIQGGHGTGKTGNLVLTFSRQGKHRENIWTVIINIKSMFIFLNFKNFSLALLGIIFNFKVLCILVPTCYVSQFYLCINSLSQYIHVYLFGI